MMSRGIKKPRVRMKSINASKTQKLSGFFDYLTQPGQMPGDELPPVYTNIEDNTAAGIKRFMNRYENNFKSAMKSGRLKNNCKLVAKSMVFALPNEMTIKEIDGYVKAVAAALPDYMTFAFAVHRGSNKKTCDSQKNLHLQGFLGIRGDGAEKFGADVRLPLHDNLINASDAYIKKIGFKIKYDPTKIQPGAGSLRCLESEAFRSALAEGVSGNRALKTRQSELLRDSGWLIKFSKRDDIRDLRLKQFCEELAFKRIKVNAEKFQKKSEFDLQFVCKNLNKVMVTQTAKAAGVTKPVEIAKPAEATMEIRVLPMPHRLRTDVETFEQRAERRRRERLAIKQAEPVKTVPSLEERLEQALSKPVIISVPSPEEKLKKLLDEMKQNKNTTLNTQIKGRKL